MLHSAAIDCAVSEKNLAFMRRQFSRAEITPWSFENEYHYGDFHGNAVEMLRRGYDIHLHYANFGIRTLLVRLPSGFPDPGQPNHISTTSRFGSGKTRKAPGARWRLNRSMSRTIRRVVGLEEILIASSRYGRRFSTATCGRFTWPTWR